MAKLLTLKWPKNGQVINSAAYIYAVKLLSGPSLGFFGSYYLVQVGFLEVIIWSKFVFLAYKNSGFKRFFAHPVIILCFLLCPIIWQFSKNSLFQKKGAKIWFFNFQCLSLNFEVLFFCWFAKNYKNRGFSNFLCVLLLKEKKTGKKW